MTEDSSISTSLFDDASYCSGEFTTNSYTVTQIYPGYSSPGDYCLDLNLNLNRYSTGSDSNTHSNRSPMEPTPNEANESKSESTFCGTMDITQVSGCEKTAAPMSISLRICYEKPKLCMLDYRRFSNILGCILFFLIGAELGYTQWATNIQPMQYMQVFAGDYDVKFPVFFTFSQYCLLTALFFIFPNLVFIFVKSNLSSALSSTFFSILTVISLMLAERFLWNGYNNASLDPEVSKKARVALLIHSVNLLYSLTVLVSSAFSIFIEHKASTYAIAY